MKYKLNKRSVRSARLIFILCVLCASVVNVFAQEWKTLNDGIEYAEVRREFGGKAVNINLLRLDLKKVRLDVHHAFDAAIGTDKTSSIATQHRAFAAINAGFFRLDSSVWAGESAGVLIMDGKLISESLNDRYALVLFNGGSKEKKVDFGHFRASVRFHFGKSDSGGFVELSGVDRERKAYEAILYDKSTFQSVIKRKGEIEIRLEKCVLSTQFVNSDSYTTCKDAEILKEDGVAKIKDPQFIILMDSEFASKNQIDEKFKALPFFLKKTTVITNRLNDGNSFVFTAGDVDVTNGVPQLIKDSKIDITWEQEKTTKAFVETRHPRTAVAKLKDGKFLMITADGRTEQSAGLDLYDLAAYLLELGATDAMNLDGGGSTTMFVDGKVVNKPSDKEGERKVSDAILVTPRKKKR